MDKVRLDRWLWAARFYKTRSQAAEAVSGGKIHVNDERPKRSKMVGHGDRLRIRLGPYEFIVTITGLAERRGSAKIAATLYVEDPAGLAVRTKLAEQLRVAPPPTYSGKGRPTKRDRREIERLSTSSEDVEEKRPGDL
jgi:ribosome-associated heat shock protein Hsp15